MAAVQNQNEERNTAMNQTEEARDFIELLKQLSGTEKAQVKGIMIGMQMSKEMQLAVQSA